MLSDFLYPEFSWQAGNLKWLNSCVCVFPGYSGSLYHVSLGGVTGRTTSASSSSITLPGAETAGLQNPL